MNTKNKNKDEFLLHALIIGMFMFVFTALNTHQHTSSQYSSHQTSIITELPLPELSASLLIPPAVPDFNCKWITSDQRTLKPSAIKGFSLLETNNRLHLAFKSCSDTYLSIKANCLQASFSLIYSSNDYSDIPALA